MDPDDVRTGMDQGSAEALESDGLVMEDHDHLASESERGRRRLWTAFLIFRWGSIAWMIVLAATATPPLHRPLLAGAAILGVIAWNAWFTLSRVSQRLPALWGDLVVTSALVIISGASVAPGQIVSDAPSIATFYKWSTPMVWGASRGLGAGVAAGSILSLAYIANRPVNGISLDELSAGQLQNMATTVVIFLAIGAAVGAVARMQQRSSMQLQAAMEQALRERERVGRLQEREKFARQIHDSVLQLLALVHKRGRELARMEPIPPEELLSLAEMARGQEEALRSLILREASLEPNGSASLRSALEEVTRTTPGLPITVSAVGPIWMPASTVAEVVSAVRQAVDNVVQHAAATRAALFAEEDDGTVMVTVRDDGKGFAYDEEALRHGGKFGILRSIKGRIEDLQGTVRVHTAPGRGTEIELSIPVVRS